MEDRIAENGDVINQLPVQPIVVAASGEACIGTLNDDANSANESGNRLAGLLAPKKRKEMGRPTTSREKAPYKVLHYISPALAPAGAQEDNLSGSG